MTDRKDDSCPLLSPVESDTRLTSLELGACVAAVPSVESKSNRIVGILSSALYTGMSVSMVMFNKAISASLKPAVREKLPDMSVIFTQCIVAVILVYSARFLRLVEFPAFDFKTALSWLPVNILFVGMLYTGFLSLTYLSVPMATVLKNLTNVLTIFGDWFLFDEKITMTTIAAVTLMTIGGLMAGYNDLQFTARGYFWTVNNCMCTAGYILYMRHASSTLKLPKFGMVAYNNALSAMILFPFCFLEGEMFHAFPSAIGDAEVYTSFFIVAVMVTGIIGFGLNFSSLWCVSSTSATTYAVVGTLNKIPITVLGYFIYDTKISPAGGAFIAMATVGGLVYGYSKLPASK